MERAFSIVLAIILNRLLYVQGQQLLGENCKAKYINEDLKFRELQTNFLSYQIETQRELNTLKEMLLEIQKQVMNGDKSMYTFQLSFII